MKYSYLIFYPIIYSLAIYFPLTINAQLSDCSMSPGNSFKYESPDGSITYIYEQAVNTNLRPPNKLAQKRYNFIPPFKVSEVEIFPNSDTSKAFLRAVFTPVPPDKQLLVQFIKNRNPFLQENNLQAACLEGYSLRYFFGTFKDDNLNTSMENSFSVHFEVPYEYASTFKQDLRRGVGIELRLQVLMKYACNNQFDINGSYDAISNIVRDFKQSTHFNGINYDVTGYNRYEMSKSLQRKISGKIIIDCEANQNTTSVINSLTKSLIQTGIEHIITFDLIEREQTLIDLNGNQYSPDLMRRLATDVKQLSESQFHKKWEHELENKSSKSGGGNFGFKGFSLGGKGSKTNETKKRTLSDEEFKEQWENTFKYEWEGEKWIPKGFKVYDNVAVKGKDEIIGEFQAQQLVKELRFIKPFIIPTSNY